MASHSISLISRGSITAGGTGSLTIIGSLESTLAAVASNKLTSVFTGDQDVTVDGAIDLLLELTTIRLSITLSMHLRSLTRMSLQTPMTQRSQVVL